MNNANSSWGNNSLRDPFWAGYPHALFSNVTLQTQLLPLHVIAFDGWTLLILEISPRKSFLLSLFETPGFFLIVLISLAFRSSIPKALYIFFGLCFFLEICIKGARTEHAAVRILCCHEIYGSGLTSVLILNTAYHKILDHRVRARTSSKCAMTTLWANLELVVIFVCNTA